MQENLNINLTTDDVMQGKYLIFGVGDGVYGIEIKYVTEIIGVQEITLVPHTNAYVKGIINLRGKIVPVIDNSMRFGGPETVFTDRTCIIVLSMGDISIGLIVEEVLEVVDIDDRDIQEPPKSEEDFGRDSFVKNIGLYNGEVKQLLDINKIFEEDEIIQ